MNPIGELEKSEAVAGSGSRRERSESGHKGFNPETFRS
jgi:hypothetical protein